MLKAVFFDLDGTILPIAESVFAKEYMGMLGQKGATRGYDPQQIGAVVWEGMRAMVKNDGSKTNEEVFWEIFSQKFGEEKLCDKQMFTDFYKNEFKGLKAYCEENPIAKEVVDFCKRTAGQVVLTTNPVFPKEGIATRLQFLGLTPNDFDDVTTYETSHYCKPNPDYFREVLSRHSLRPEEVVLFGNNVYEDGDCGTAAGLRVVMVGNYILTPKHATGEYPHISFNEIPQTLLQLKKEMDDE